MKNDIPLQKKLINLLKNDVDEPMKKTVYLLDIVHVSTYNLLNQIHTLKTSQDKKTTNYYNLLDNTKKQYNRAVKEHNKANDYMGDIQKTLKKINRVAQYYKLNNILSLTKKHTDTLEQCIHVYINLKYDVDKITRRIKTI